MNNTFCPKCGSKQEGNSFCSKCGNKLKEDSTASKEKNAIQSKPVKEEKTIMKKSTFYTLIFLLAGLIIIGGRFLGWSFESSVFLAAIIGVLLEIYYRTFINNPYNKN